MISEVLNLVGWRQVDWSKYPKAFIENYIAKWSEPARAKPEFHEKNLPKMFSNWTEEILIQLADSKITVEEYDEIMQSYDYTRNLIELAEFFNSKMDYALEPRKKKVLTKYQVGDVFDFDRLTADFQKTFGTLAQSKLDQLILDGYLTTQEQNWRLNV
jgi:hypothetical protein